MQLLNTTHTAITYNTKVHASIARIEIAARRFQHIPASVTTTDERAVSISERIFFSSFHLSIHETRMSHMRNNRVESFFKTHALARARAAFITLLALRSAARTLFPLN